MNQQPVTELALYKGPATGFKNRVGHLLTCIADTIRLSMRSWRVVIVKHSHVELVIDGVCYSSSFRDGGVRKKVIEDLRTSGHFDIFPVELDAAAALRRFAQDEGKAYDWLGMLRCSTWFRWLPASVMKRFCSEAVIWMARGVADPETYSPEDVRRALVR